MLDTYFVSFGVAVRPIRVAGEGYSGMSHHAESSAALPRWHSSILIGSKKPGGNHQCQLVATFSRNTQLAIATSARVRRSSWSVANHCL